MTRRPRSGATIHRHATRAIVGGTPAAVAPMTSSSNCSRISSSTKPNGAQIHARASQPAPRSPPVGPVHRWLGSTSVRSAQRRRALRSPPPSATASAAGAGWPRSRRATAAAAQHGSHQVAQKVEGTRRAAAAAAGGATAAPPTSASGDVVRAGVHESVPPVRWQVEKVAGAAWRATHGTRRTLGSARGRPPHRIDDADEAREVGGPPPQ